MTALLMTATVAPAAAMPEKALRDPDLRVRHYAEALGYYLSVPGPAFRILLAENSGARLDALEAVAAAAPPGRPVHIHSYRSEVPPEQGKGRAELELIDRAMDAFAPLLGAGEPVWKVTGRLRVRNLAEMLRTAPARFSVYADLRRVPLIGDALGGNRWMDCRLFAFTPQGHAAHLAGTWRESWISVEKYLYARLVARMADDPLIVPRLRRQPRLSGVSARGTANYDSLAYAAKDALRATTRRLALALWI